MYSGETGIMFFLCVGETTSIGDVGETISTIIGDEESVLMVNWTTLSYDDSLALLNNYYILINNENIQFHNSRTNLQCIGKTQGSPKSLFIIYSNLNNASQRKKNH